MTDIHYFCDSCGERITDQRTALRMTCGPLRHRYPNVDLCPQCLSKFDDMLLDSPPSTLEAPPRDSEGHRNGATVH